MISQLLAHLLHLQLLHQLQLLPLLLLLLLRLNFWQIQLPQQQGQSQ